MKKLLLILVISVFAVSSCKKESAKNCSLSEATLVGKYKVTAMKYKLSASSPEMDYFALMFEPCQKDDITTFSANHTYTYLDAGTACNPKGDDNGTWSLNGNTLSLDGDPATVENFSCSGFTVYVTNAATAGDKMSVTYTKQ